MSSAIEIEQGSSKKFRNQFIKVPWKAKIYEKDSMWIAKPILDQKHFLDPKKGYFYEMVKLNFLLPTEMANRLAEFLPTLIMILRRYTIKKQDFFGFYESIDDVEIAKALFDTAEAWLKEKGKTKIMGPESFGIYDEVGFITDGLENSPVVGLFHYAGYYKDLAEQCGFQKSIDWHCFLVKAIDQFEPFLKNVRENIMKEQDITYKEMGPKEFSKRRHELKDIFNSAWDKNWGHLPLTEKQFDTLVSELKTFVIPDLAIFAEHEGETVGFILSIPDVNPALKLLKGHLYPWRLIRFLLNYKKSKRLRTVLMGVKPEYRGKKINAVLVLKTIENGINLGFKDSDCSLIVETNDKMIKSLEPWNAERYKTYRIYERAIK